MSRQRNILNFVCPFLILIAFSFLMVLSEKIINPDKKEFLTFGNIVSIEEKNRTLSVKADQSDPIILPEIENFETYREILKHIFQEKKVAEIFWEQIVLPGGKKETRIIWVEQK